MAIWTKLIKEYFYRNELGTSKQIVNWIYNDKYDVVRNYVLEWASSLRPKIIADSWLNKPKNIDKRTTELINVETISPILKRMFKKKILMRKITDSSNCKWKYFISPNQKK